MYEVRSKVYGSLTFSNIGRAFGSYGQSGEMREKDLQDPEVKRALRDGRLEIVAERSPAGPPEGVDSNVILSNKDWQVFRKIMLECADTVAEKVSETMREEMSKFLEAAPRGKVTAPPDPYSYEAQRPSRKRRVQEEEYIITPTLSEGESKVEVQESSEDGGDMLEGLAALRSLREEDGDGR